MSLIPALLRQKLEDFEFETSLFYRDPGQGQLGLHRETGTRLVYLGLFKIIVCVTGLVICHFIGICYYIMIVFI